jgi:hypothetical protein
MKTAFDLVLGIVGAFFCATLLAQPPLADLPPIGPHHRVVPTESGA